MATLNGGRVTSVVRGGSLRTFTLSGTVKLSGVGVSRQILIYKGADYDLYESTQSDSFGNWSKEVVGNSNDKFRVICIGISGENSEIYEHVSG